MLGHLTRAIYGVKSKHLLSSTRSSVRWLGLDTRIDVDFDIEHTLRSLVHDKAATNTMEKRSDIDSAEN
jgi:hypothetical protein